MRAAVTLLAFLVADGGATDALRARDAEVRAALPPPGHALGPEARNRIESIFSRAVDVDGMVASAMGVRWKALTPKQRKRLLTAFGKRLRQAGGENLQGYRSAEIEYRSEVALPDGAVQVPTRVVAKGEPTDVVYLMRRDGDAWRIVDIVVDGVSTVENYRASFARVIAKEGVEGLIRRFERGSANPG